MSDAPVRVLLVDDHELFRQGLRQLLEVDGLIEVVAEGSNGSQAVALAAELRPDVLLLDLEMPGQDVLATLDQLRVRAPEVVTIVLTMYEDPVRIRQTVGAGAAAYLVKTIARRDLVAAVCSSAAGGSDVVTLNVPRRAVTGMQNPVRDSTLSTREIEVLSRVAQAETNGQIAARLFITEGTVKRHLSNIYAKLGARSRLDAVRLGIKAGVLADDSLNAEPAD